MYYKNKYVKYKNKYLGLKYGGGIDVNIDKLEFIIDDSNLINIKKHITGFSMEIQIDPRATYIFCCYNNEIVGYVMFIKLQHFENRNFNILDSYNSKGLKYIDEELICNKGLYITVVYINQEYNNINLYLFDKIISYSNENRFEYILFISKGKIFDMEILDSTITGETIYIHKLILFGYLKYIMDNQGNNITGCQIISIGKQYIGSLVNYVKPSSAEQIKKILENQNNTIIFRFYLTLLSIFQNMTLINILPYISSYKNDFEFFNSIITNLPQKKRDLLIELIESLSEGRDATIPPSPKLQELEAALPPSPKLQELEAALPPSQKLQELEAALPPKHVEQQESSSQRKRFNQSETTQQQNSKRANQLEAALPQKTPKDIFNTLIQKGTCNKWSYMIQYLVLIYLRKILNIPKEGKLVDNFKYIDICCGAAEKTNIFQRQLSIPNENKYGTDINAWGKYNDNEKRLSNFNPQTNFRFIENNKIQYMDEYFDFATCIYSLHHINALEDFIKEINRILKTGGIILIVEHNVTNDFERIIVDIEHTLYSLIYDPEVDKDIFNYTNCYSIYEWNFIFEKNGFELITFNNLNIELNINYIKDNDMPSYAFYRKK